MTRCARLATLSLSLVGVAAADTIHVPAEQPTIRDAVIAATDGDEIIVASGTYGEAIDFLGKRLVIHSVGGPSVTTIDASGFDAPVITCSSGEPSGTVIRGFTILGGAGRIEGACRVGGGLFVQNSALEIEDCEIRGHRLEQCAEGGGLFATNAELRLIDSRLLDNHVTGVGGALACRDSIVSLMRCQIELNIASQDGGGIFAADTDLSISDCSFFSNAAAIEVGGDGAGLCAERGTLQVLATTFDRNQCVRSGSGGGIYIDRVSEATVTDSVFSENESGQGGGAFMTQSSGTLVRNDWIRNDGGRKGGAISIYGEVLIAGSQFIGNTAEKGGALYTGLNVQVFDCDFRHNAADDDGGAILGDAAHVDRCLFVRNHARRGGAIYQFRTLSGCTFIANSADLEGGALDNTLSHGPVRDCVFQLNRARDGGAVTLSTDGTRFYNCVFQGNTAERGGAISSAFGDAMIVNATMVQNSASDGGGAIAAANTRTELINSICWFNGPDAVQVDETLILYCNIEGGLSGPSNMDAAPLFVDMDRGDLRLRHGSPCIDAGNSDLVSGSIDLGGLPRFVDDRGKPDVGAGPAPRVDMGAHEFQATSKFSLTIYPTPVRHAAATRAVVANAATFTRVWLAFSTSGTGRTHVPGLGATLNLDQPTRLRSRTTNELGAATWRLPEFAPLEGPILFQAVHLHDTSNVVGTHVVAN